MNLRPSTSWRSHNKHHNGSRRKLPWAISTPWTTSSSQTFSSNCSSPSRHSTPIQCYPLKWNPQKNHRQPSRLCQRKCRVERPSHIWARILLTRPKQQALQPSWILLWTLVQSSSLHRTNLHFRSCTNPTLFWRNRLLANLWLGKPREHNRQGLLSSHCNRSSQSSYQQGPNFFWIHKRRSKRMLQPYPRISKGERTSKTHSLSWHQTNFVVNWSYPLPICCSYRLPILHQTLPTNTSIGEYYDHNR